MEETDNIETANNETSMSLISDRPEAGKHDFMLVVSSKMMYKIGESLDKFYFLILVPMGVTGNILSFLVMIQKHNRHKSFSMYICVLAVTDTAALLIAFCRYLNQVHQVDMFLDTERHCTVAATCVWIFTMCSTLLIVSMTFERFYSIIQPHKAASFNTVKKAKISIISIVIFSLVYNIPHVFVTSSQGTQCVPYGKSFNLTIVQVHYWFSFVINFAFPFVFLLTMNSVIIHTIRKRLTDDVVTKLRIQDPSKGEGHGNKGQGQGMKSSEKQIYIILVLITFAFLILTTPTYAMFLYANIVDYTKTPESFAAFFLFFSVGEKLYYTNNGINFYLYVMSGQKFRHDLISLFSFRKEKPPGSTASTVSSLSNTKITSIE